MSTITDEYMQQMMERIKEYLLLILRLARPFD
jgi:hypothetical protein